jgi:hypothetical protein
VRTHRCKCVVSLHLSEPAYMRAFLVCSSYHIYGERFMVQSKESPETTNLQLRPPELKFCTPYVSKYLSLLTFLCNFDHLSYSKIIAYM